MTSRNDLKDFLNTIPNNVNVICASKYADSSVMRRFYEAGIKEFGENRVESLLSKYVELHDLKDIKWHFIGHLQRNKAALIINKIDCLHSLDSLDLARIIDLKRTKPLDCFIEVNINNEESKSGISIIELPNFINELKKYNNINVIGLMTMARNHDTLENYTYTFSTLKKLGDLYNLKCFSMGMSEDYLIAIKCGATHLRLGHILYEE